VTFGQIVVQALQRWVGDEYSFWARCKRAAILGDWMHGTSIQDIEQKVFSPIRWANSIRRCFEIRGRYPVSLTLSASNPFCIARNGPAQEQEFESVLTQLEFGVPTDFNADDEASFRFVERRMPCFGSRGVRAVTVSG